MMGTDTFQDERCEDDRMPLYGNSLCRFAGTLPRHRDHRRSSHVHEADIYGNCRVRGITISDFDLARASKHVIITCERLIPNEEIRREPSLTVIPYWCVDAVCEVPYGSYPGNMLGEYFSDEEHLKEWLKVEQEADAFRKFLDRNIYTCKDHFEYIERNGGLQKLQLLRQKEMMLIGARA